MCSAKSCPGLLHLSWLRCAIASLLADLYAAGQKLPDRLLAGRQARMSCCYKLAQNGSYRHHATMKAAHTGRGHLTVQDHSNICTLQRHRG